MPLQLFGDGLHDDTDAIQSMLDSGKRLIELPEPEKNYLISRTLKVHSGQELVLSRWTVIRMAPKSGVPMLSNSDCVNGNSRIAIRGGIWDYDNVNQAPNPIMVGRPQLPVPPDYPADPLTGKRGALQHDAPYHPDRYWGEMFRFVRVDQFEMSDIVLKNPVTYAAKFAWLSNFTIRHVTFDFNEGNPSPDNMDGLHFDGCCRNGFISDIKGACYDDLLAFNADDGIVDSPVFGPIENITVDGIFADRCHSVVRLLSTGSMIRNITIRNVFGTYYRYAFGFTHYFPERKSRGFFDNMVFENLFIGKALPLPSDWNKFCPDWGLIWGEGCGTVGSLRISGLHRIEETTPTPTIELGADFEVERLTVEDCSMENHLPSPVTCIQNAGRIGRLTFDGCRIVPVEGGGKVTELDNSGTIGEIVSH